MLKCQLVPIKIWMFILGADFKSHRLQGGSGRRSKVSAAMPSYNRSPERGGSEERGAVEEATLAGVKKKT